MLFTIGSALAPLLAPHDPTRQDLRNATSPPIMMRGWDRHHLLGTDQLGRDLLSRLLFGGRVSLGIAVLSVALSGGVGVVLGLLSGYYGGVLEASVMRIVDIQLAFPPILLAVSIVSVSGRGLSKIIMVLAITGWVVYVRVVRGVVLQIRNTEYVIGARAVGASDSRIIFRHILPNAAGPIIVVATFAVPQMIIYEASLSFLGLGVQPPTPTWGGMLSDSREYLVGAWWMAMLPGLAITIVVLCLNLVGDWLRDVLDPTLRI